MADCTVITTELDDTLITESGLELVTENSVCPGDVVAVFEPEGPYLLRQFQLPLKQLSWY